MNVLVIGGGGREHALVWKLQQSTTCDTIYCAPGNPGMNAETLDLETPEDILHFAEKNRIGCTVVGPEAPLCNGIVDRFREKNLRIVGPDAHAARLEGSKSFAKDFMQRHGIPTAESRTFTDRGEAEAWIRRHGAPVVVKADGLAAGKGVTVAAEEREALEAVKECFDGRFGEAGESVVVEECLVGEEASIIALTDGKTILPLATSQDHKPVGEGDTGPNTGGMGAYSPAPVVTPERMTQIRERILDRFLAGVQKDNLDFRGIIYAGIMVCDSGVYVLEFNVRFGDPETQAILPRLESDLLETLVAAADGRLEELSLTWSPNPAVCVVMASEGYPGAYEKGREIAGIDDAEAKGATVFHAGTRIEDGRILTNGGRVLGVTATGPSFRKAVDNAYEAVRCIRWEGAYYRRDIAHRALDRE